MNANGGSFKSSSIGDAFSKTYSDNNLGDFKLVGGRLVKSTGFGWIIAALFVVGEMAGSGIIALPTAINRASFYLGLCVLVLVAILATSSAIFLGKAWLIMLRLYPKYRTHCRKPYAEMGYRACGPKAKLLVSICLNFTQFGASTCFLLLISKNVSNFLMWFNGTSISYCWIIIIVAVVISPILMCKSPNDFWQGVVMGMFATGVAVVLISIGAHMDAKCVNSAVMPDFRIQNFFLALGTILFTFGGHSAFPTIQHDMRRPGDFAKSSVLAFIIITVLNLVVVYWGVSTYGDSLHDGIIESIQTAWIQQAVNLLIGLHCLMTLTLLINPLYQEMEEFFKVPQEFGVKRVILRLIVFAALVFVSESVPSFEKILGFVGASFLTITSLVFPPIFYLFLAANEKRIKHAKTIKSTNVEFMDDDTAEYGQISFSEMLQTTDPKILILCITIAVCGIFLGGVATVVSAKDIVNMNADSSVPCYWGIFNKNFNASAHDPESIVTRCCGVGQNISTIFPSAKNISSNCPKAKNFYNVSIF